MLRYQICKTECTTFGKISYKSISIMKLIC